MMEQHPLKNVPRKLKAFSLIEIGIALLVVGVLIGAALKGRDMLESARHISVSKDFQNIKRALCAYQDTYQALPGDDAHAHRFGAHVLPGDGDLKISDQESPKVWEHLYAAELWRKKESPVSKLGGVYRVYSDNDNQLWIVLSQDSRQHGLLTPKQALRLKNKLLSMDGDLSDDDIVIDNGHNPKSLCIDNGNLIFSNSDKVCILRYKVN